MGPVEVAVIGFPGSQFNGSIIPALQDVVDKGIVTIVDCLIISKNEDGSVDFTEIEEITDDEGINALQELFEEASGLLSDEDVEAFAEALEPGDTAAALVFEHTWARAFKEAVVDSGGVLVANIRVPGVIADQVLAALEEEE